jgi:hypothetical protein
MGLNTPERDRRRGTLGKLLLTMVVLGLVGTPQLVVTLG